MDETIEELNDRIEDLEEENDSLKSELEEKERIISELKEALENVAYDALNVVKNI